jgi:hypothetical protein
VHAAGTIAAPLLAATTQALISLIAASGLRLGEALALNRGDVDLHDAVLRVTGKNDQTRLVPLHATTAAMLAGYATRRDQLCPAAVSPSFFVTTTGHRVQQRGVQQTFAKLLVLAGMDTPSGRRRPRIHDLRHTFAVNILIGLVPQRPAQQVLHPIRAGIAGVLGDRPAVLAWQVGQQATHERPGPPPQIHPAKPTRDPTQQLVQQLLPPGGIYVYAVACGHRLIFGCPHNTGSSTVAPP